MSALAAARITTPGIDWLSIAPVAILGLTAVAIVLARALIRKRPVAYPVAMGITILGLALTVVALGAQWRRFRVEGAYQALSGMVAVDGFAVFIGLVVVFATAMAVLLASRYLVRERHGRRNHHRLVLDRPMRHPLEASHTVGELVTALVSQGAREPSAG